MHLETLPKLEPWPEVGAGLHLDKMCVSANMSGCKQTDHTFFHHGILICTLALCYFYIWTMSLHLDGIEMFHFVAQASTTAKALIRHPCHNRAKWTGEIFRINWWKVYQKSFFSPVLLMRGMSVISYDEEDYYCGRTGIRFVKNKTGEVIFCLWLSPCILLIITFLY